MRGPPKKRGIEVIIAGAGGAAHLAGMTASKTVLPVLGVPVESKALKGLTPPLHRANAQRHPCRRARHRQIRRRQRRAPRRRHPWRKAPRHSGSRSKVPRRSTGRVLPTLIPRGFATDQERQEQVTIGILGGGQLGYMLALAGYPLGLHFRFLDPSPEAPVGRIAQRVTADFSDQAALEKILERP